MSPYTTPGVYRQDVFPAPAAELLTGVPVFLGHTGAGDVDVPRRLGLAADLDQPSGAPPARGFLDAAVRGFFANGGALCWVIRLGPGDAVDALRRALAAAAPLGAVDLVCAPDIVTEPVVDRVVAMQRMVLEHCDGLGDRFALLDSLPGASAAVVLAQRRRLRGTNGALYYPWLRVGAGGAGGAGGAVAADPVPPCGHVAGVYARSDRGVGVHKAPANEPLDGVLDLERAVDDAEQGPLNEAGVNALRVRPGRGIRVWGARTLAADPAWRYVNVRRLFLTAGRGIERRLAGITFEPNEPRLWARIARELTASLTDLHRRGALRGQTAAEAFYVKCDADTNPPDERDAGLVAAEIGLATASPGEFVVVRVVHGAGGVTLAAAG